MENPKIRFKGFTKDWEQRKFGEITELKSASRVHKDEWTSNGVPFYRSSDVMTAINGTENEKAFISEELYEKLSKVSGKLEEGDILVTGGGSVGNPYIVPDNKPLYTKDADLLWIKNKGKFHPYFLYEFFFSPTFRNYLGSISHVGTIAHYTITQLSDTPISLPSFEEQKEVGEYFQSLDCLITLHQRKCEQTKKLKKYMLQKMFPQNGEKIPKIRFDGFTYDWEQRKLGDVFEQTSNLVNPKEDEIELWSLTVEDGLTQKSDRYNREFLVKKDDNFKEVRPGDIVYNPMNMTLGAVGYNGMAKSVAVSGYYTTMVAKENYDTYYINTWLKSPQAIRLYRTYATGSLIEKQRVQFPTLSIIPVTFPKYEEQTKIGSYFHSLDHLITLHQRQHKLHLNMLL